MPNVKHSTEYTRYINSDQWRALSRRCIASTGHRCCVYPDLRATQSHHVSYDNLGRETIGLDIFPVSEAGHRLLHHDRFWQGGELRNLARKFLIARYAVLKIK